MPASWNAARIGDRMAWVINQEGVRNVWVAEAPRFKPREVTRFTADDGQEITQLTFSPDGNELVFVRGGDHDANWPVKVAPDPASSPVAPKVMLWAVDLHAGAARELTEGDAPATSSTGRLAYLKDDQVWATARGLRCGRGSLARRNRGQFSGMADNARGLAATTRIRAGWASSGAHGRDFLPWPGAYARDRKGQQTRAPAMPGNPVAHADPLIPRADADRTGRSLERVQTAQATGAVQPAR